MGCRKAFPQVLGFYKHQRCQTLPALRERRRRKLGDQPTPEKRFPEVVPILRECGKSCVESSPESLKDLIHIAHAFEDQERCCLQTAFGTIRRQCGHRSNLLYTSRRQASNNQAVRQARWTVPAEHDRQADCPQVLEMYTHQRCQTLPELRERRRRKLGDQPTPEKRFRCWNRNT